MYKLAAILYFLFLNLGFSQGWESISDFPGNARDDGTSFTIGDTVYVGTGLNSWWSPEADFYAFDVVSELWISVTSLPSGKERQYASGFSGNQNGYVFGGVNGSTLLNDLWEYDPLNDTWVEKMPLPSFGRSGSASFVINDTAYIIGGKSPTLDAVDEVWAYSILNNSWVQKNNLSFGKRWRVSVASDDTSGFLIFGKDELGDFQDELYTYDPASDSWTLLSTFPNGGRTHSSLLVESNTLKVLFGLDEINEFTNDYWSYNLNLNSWNSLNSLPASPRKGGIGFFGNGKVFYTTGIDTANVRLVETWKFDPFLVLKENDLSDLKVYPNPAENIINIQNSQEEIIGIKIRGINGVVLLEGKSSKFLNISFLNRGVYILEVSYQSHFERVKIIKTN